MSLPMLVAWYAFVVFYICCFSFPSDQKKYLVKYMVIENLTYSCTCTTTIVQTSTFLVIDQTFDGTCWHCFCTRTTTLSTHCSSVPIIDQSLDGACLTFLYSLQDKLPCFGSILLCYVWMKYKQKSLWSKLI